MQVPGTGITIDYGHSIYSGESPSQALNLIKQSGIEYYIHINDNDKTWDWDFFCGSHTLLEYIEFIYYVMKFGYDRYMTSDTHPTRWNIQEMFAANVRLTRKVMELIETIGLEEFDKVIHQPDYMKTWAFIEERILRL
jgi:xylose isomerase